MSFKMFVKNVRILAYSLDFDGRKGNMNYKVGQDVNRNILKSKLTSKISANKT